MSETKSLQKKIKTNFTIKISSDTVKKIKDEETNIDLDKNTAIDVKSSISGKPQSSKVIAGLAYSDKTGQDIKQSNTPKDTDNATTDSKDNENTSYEKTHDWGAYTPYITYEDKVAIYTDPNTNIVYVWDNIINNWKPKDGEQSHVVEESSRVYSYENDEHIYTETDGSKFFWDTERNAWIPKIDDDFLAQYQMAYGFVDNTTKISDEDITEEEEEEKKVEKKQSETADAGLKRKIPEPPKWFDADQDNTTKVYVSNLPLDITDQEFVDFMQKCGLVMRDPSTQKMKIKLYTDKETNLFKGDALCSYIKIESVDLALNLLDGSDLKGNKIQVQKALFQMKGDYNPALKPKKKRKKELEKLKKAQEKLFDWRPEKIKGERSKHERVVIAKNVFDPTDFDKDVKLILDYQEDLREECSKCGEVRKVVIYDRHPEGVVQVTMKEPEQADAVVTLINGRWFGKRQLFAEIWDGRTKYKIAETDADLNKRAQNWDKFLDQEDKKLVTENLVQKTVEVEEPNPVEKLDETNAVNKEKETNAEEELKENKVKDTNNAVEENKL